MASENLEAVISYAQSQSISLDKAEFEFQIESHPDYPSLLAFSDAFSFFKIPNMAAKIFADQIENLPNSFVALLGEDRKENYLAHITEKNGLYQFTYEKQTKKLNIKELKQYWRDVVLLVEKPEDFLNSKSKNNNARQSFISISSLFILGIIYYFSGSLFSVLFSAISMVGIFFSVEALKTELGIESKVSKNMCSIVANADCSNVINSNKNTWLKNIKISDISIWFFGSQLLSLVLFSVLGTIESYFLLLLFELVLAIPMTLYSIYFQYEIEKKWCPICLSIIALVYLQFLLLAINYSFLFSFNLKDVLLFVFSLCVIALSVYMIKPLLLNIKNLKEENIKNLRFKRNYSVFKNTLKKDDQQFFEHENIVLGNPNANLKISIITNPFCSYCKEAHEILHQILSKYEENLNISVRFNYNEDFDKKNKKLFLRLIEIHREQGGLEFSDALSFWFENKNMQQWLSKYGEPKNNIEIEKLLKKVGDENIQKELNFTPNIFINQFKFPQFYERKDLEYFISELIDDDCL
ncbi:thioredoxin domain-containing protein [Flavobacteriaceae bacterium W22]|nr:thioredoxin domain-containing protein [Flavobacteriaceae bacterium W22]